MLSTADIKQFVDNCGAEVSARWNQMELQMESEMSLNRGQMDFMREEYKADNWKVIKLCRSQCESIMQEAQNHGRHCMNEVQEHQKMLIDVQRGLLDECGNKEALIAQAGIQLSSECHEANVLKARLVEAGVERATVYQGGYEEAALVQQLRSELAAQDQAYTVSYTHLTLPTNREV